MRNSIPFRFRVLSKRNPHMKRTTMTYKMDSKPQMTSKDNNIPGTAAPWKRNLLRRIWKNLTLTQSPRMPTRNRHLYLLPRLRSHPIRRPRGNQRHTQDRPPMKGLIRYHTSTPPLRVRHHSGRPPPVTSPRGRRDLACWRGLSVRQDHPIFPQRADLKTRSICQIGRE